MVALLVFALLELLAQRANPGESGTALLAHFAAVSVLVLVFHDGSALRRVTGLAPPLPEIQQTLGFPPADRYVTTHVGDVFRERNDEVISTREVFGRGAADPVMVSAAMEQGAVIVAWYHGLMGRAKRSGYERLQVILFKRAAVDGAARARAAIEYIEFVYRQFEQRGRPVRVEISKTRISVD